MEAKTPSRLERWALRLSEFDFTIKHKRGKDNVNANGLARLPIINSVFIQIQIQK